MKNSNKLLITVGVVFGLFVGLVGIVQSQEGSPGPILFITGSDSASAPVIDLHVFGMDGQGQALAFDPANVDIAHGSSQTSDIQVAGQVDGGTFTIFLIDIAPGVTHQVEAIQAAIERFASPPTMQEQLDYIALYRVGEQDAVQLLAPTTFYNEVRNLLQDPLSGDGGPTALVDSAGNLLGQINTLKPNPDLAASIVLITDGTDVVSTQFEANDIAPLAASLGVPIHTIHLDNTNLSRPEVGIEYLRGVAASSRGVAGVLGSEADLNNIWNRIASLRSRTVLRYTVASPQGGDQEVTVQLADQPGASDTTVVSFPAGAPSVMINLPQEYRSITLDNLDDSVRLRLGATVSWLDGVERSVSQAQLYVNDLQAQQLDPASLATFVAEISQFQYGENTLQVLVMDEQGMRAASPEITMTVLEGETQIPEEIAAAGLIDSLLQLLLICGGVLLALVVILFILTRLGLLKAGRASSLVGAIPRPRVRKRFPEANTAEIDTAPSPPPSPDMPAGASLEVLESVTRMPRFLSLDMVETRVGRSPAEADIVFENDITVSRLHASIIFTEGEYRLYDEQSTSGTLLNGQGIPDYGAPLIDGDEIRFGAVRTYFRLGGRG